MPLKKFYLKVFRRPLDLLKQVRVKWHTVDFIGTTTCWLIDPHPLGAIFGWEQVFKKQKRSWRAAAVRAKALTLL